ncbi:tyrosine-type recombinase/integrase [Roseateles sp. UC29_93]|uniref:tyrosine-type recombinase/integrase n=1 Tax=Roseateles sp. UC29_93 TaxID=3350177 RepID=UPI0036732727
MQARTNEDFRRGRRSSIPLSGAVAAMSRRRLPGLARTQRQNHRACLPSYRQVGNIAHEHMASQAVLPLLRRILKDAQVQEADTYSSHSLRRGFAGWASANGWDLKELMEHVGWRDLSSAMRYIDVPQDAVKSKIERALAASSIGQKGTSR